MKTIKLFILTALLSLVAGNALAGSSSKTYYSKATVTSTGNGKVYVSTNKNAPEDETVYVEESSATYNTSSTSSPVNHSYFLFAMPEEGYKLAGYYDNADCEGNAYEMEDNKVVVATSSTTPSSPATLALYAKFIPEAAKIPLLSYEVDHIYADLANTTEAANELTQQDIDETIVYTSSNENVATVDAEGKLTLLTNGSAIIKAAANGVSAEYIITVLDTREAGKTQIGNGDFEDWTTVTSSNAAPNNWNSFQTAEGDWANTANGLQVEMSTDVHEGSNGMYSAKIYSRNVFLGIVAQGNMTLGCINAGSTSAANKDNHNFSKITDPLKSETIDAIPSAIKVWVKFVPGKANADFPYARVAATVHDEYNYITYGQKSDDTEVNNSHAIAQAEQNFEACDWTLLTIPFTRNYAWEKKDGQKYIIVNFSTNATPGKGQLNDELYIDDIELVYDEPVLNTIEAGKYTITGKVKLAEGIDAAMVPEAFQKYIDNEEYASNIEIEGDENELTVKGNDEGALLNGFSIESDGIIYNKYLPITLNEKTFYIVDFTDKTKTAGQLKIKKSEDVEGAYTIENCAIYYPKAEIVVATLEDLVVTVYDPTASIKAEAEVSNSVKKYFVNGQIVISNGKEKKNVAGIIVE